MATSISCTINRILTPVSLPAPGLILAQQDHGTAIASICFVGIADTDRLDGFDGVTRRMGRVAHCRWRMRIAQRTTDSSARRRGRLLLFCSAAISAILIIPQALIITSLASITLITISIAAAPDGLTRDVA
jgi:hypothetical protein